MHRRLATSRLVLVPVLPLIGALVFAGCRSDGRAPAQVSAVSSVHETRQQFVETRAQVDEMIAATRSLADLPADLSEGFARFNRELSETQETAAAAAARTADLRGRASAYLERWQADMQQVSSDQLRATASDRVRAVSARYEAITTAAGATRDAYQPFIHELTDLQAYLSHDLTAAGVRAARPAFDQAITRGQTLQQALDALIAELDEVAQEMAPTVATTP